jgi:hypothetical protein
MVNTAFEFNKFNMPVISGFLNSNSFLLKRIYLLIQNSQDYNNEMGKDLNNLNHSKKEILTVRLKIYTFLPGFHPFFATTTHALSHHRQGAN